MALPAELMECIVELLPPSALSSLRLVSREMGARVLRVFSKTLFTDRAFILSKRSSMNNLYKLSRRTTFAKDVRHIRFLPLVLSSTEDFEGWCQWSDSRSTRSERAWNSHVVLLHHEMKTDEAKFLRESDTRNVGKVLESAFTHFKDTGNCPDILFH